MSLQKIVEDKPDFPSLFNELTDKPTGYIHEGKNIPGLLFARVLEDSIELIYNKLNLDLFKKAASYAGLHFQESKLKEVESMGCGGCPMNNMCSPSAKEEIHMIRSKGFFSLFKRKPIMQITNKIILVYDIKKSSKVLEKYNLLYIESKDEVRNWYNKT